MYVVKKDGETVMIIKAEGMKVDVTDERTVLVFTQGGVDYDLIQDSGTPYLQESE